MHIYYLWYFFIGALLGNGMSHFIWGVSKTVAKSPFAHKSQPVINVSWGLANFIAATLFLLWQITLNTSASVSLIALIFGFWVTVLLFGFGINRFIHGK